MTEEKYVKTSITLPEDYIRYLDKIQVEEDMSRSQAIRAAIRLLRAQREQEKEGK